MKVYMFVNVDWFFLSHRLEIAEEALKRNVEMTVYTDLTVNHSEDAFDGFSIIQSPITRKRKSIIESSIELLKAYVLIKNSRPDIIHAVTIKPIIFLGIIALIFKVPLIASITGLGPAFSKTGIFNKIRRRLVMFVYKIILLPETTRVICQSSHDAETLIANRISSRDKIIMTNGSGIRISKFNNHKKEKADAFNILMASRLLSDKGVKEFCAAAGAINKEKSFETKFYLAGPIDSDSPGALTEKQVFEMCQSNNVEFLGNIDDIPSLLSDTHIFVLPSYYAEGVPKVLLEAAASGCAVITTDHPGCRDSIIPGETGLAIKPKDVSSLINGLRKLLSKPHLIASMGKAGRELAIEKYSIDKVIDIHYSVYHSLINEES